MKILKSAVIAFSLTTAMGAFSTAAVAESDPGRVSHAPSEVIKEVSARITAAEAAIDNGASPDEINGLIKKARDFTKELNANDKVARETAKVRDHMKAAEKSVKEANSSEAKAHLQKAKEANEGLKKLL
ncbi:hypothetical protein IVG45_14400 [Methylomonas sp. LL1]|uniref:hypothetical protein n=1 Tax=Methylomonas sp. LL1 TaxID=2785785 RepID=UPI0018C38559|nr:hypothetical protein [Methylomonas sp. LL1]QPK62044.1 hypothetical protein IVG45_14400 [Methylomonas sp. LL1]CAG1022527.1 hypothetical protein MTYM_01791 [Methylococcales bacterium]